MTTDAVQDYLKAIYSLQGDGRPVTTTRVADRLNIAAPSVSAMIKKLDSRGLVEHAPYKGVRLSEEGERLALAVVRTHRLLEAYLHEMLGVPWDEVHAEAEVLEHAISDQLSERIAKALGNPTHDPHGDPIPPRNGRHTEKHFDALDEAEVGSQVSVRRVSDRDPAALRYLGSLGIVPGASLTVVEQAPFGGPVWIKSGRRKHAIGRELARTVYVDTVVEASG